MTISAAEDFKKRSLGALPTLLERLAYICSLHADGSYAHWGLTRAFGNRLAQEAILKVHSDMAVPGFDKVNGTLEFRTPLPIFHAAALFVHLDKGARQEQRVHGQVAHANVSVGVLFLGQLLQVLQGDHAPVLDHPAQVEGAVKIEARIKLYRHLRRAPSRDNLQTVGFAGTADGEISR